MANPGYLERLLAVAGGVLLIRKGMAIKGVLGAADIVLGSVAIYRGLGRARSELPPAYQLKHLPEVAQRVPRKAVRRGYQPQVFEHDELGPDVPVKTPFQQPFS
ncbi:MAG: hypothetical protein AAAB16_11890 [Pseudomonas sp.]|uniref:hypothetical protein n=1 Tax=Pseudomonas sp. TaxID=306 RepID=UPI0030F2295C